MPFPRNKFPIVLVGLLGLFSACAAQDDFCEALKPKVLACLSNTGRDQDAAIRQDNELLLRCSQFDSLDMVYWRYSGFGAIIAGMLAEGMGPVTYGDVLQKVDSIVHIPEYQRMKQAVAAGDFSMPGNEPEPEATTSQPYEFRPFQSLNDCLAAARDSNKRVLLYFSGYAVVNCRKMEERVLSDAAVQRRIDSTCVAYVLYTDDHTLLHPGTSIPTTLGDRAAGLQTNAFGSNTQPCFVLLNAKGRVLRKGFYMTEPGEFLDFLDGK